MPAHPFSCEAPVLYPSQEQMKDFASYISSLPPAVLDAGLCKVIPPPNWEGPRARLPPRETVIYSPILQHVDGFRGTYRIIPEETSRLSFARFSRSASARIVRELRRESFAEEEEQELVERFWRDITSAKPGLYGADQEGSLFPDHTEMPAWNLRALNDMLRTGPAAIDKTMPGVNTPYLYYGAWRTIFGLHIEDADLYSINYLHAGAPKVWVGAPARCSELIEMIAATLFAEEYGRCKQFLRHKSHLISPELLTGNGVPLASLIQREGEFVITFPRAYHFGFNLGLNCAESTNFALPLWLEFATKVARCNCPAGRGVACIDPAPFLAAMAKSRSRRKRSRCANEAERGGEPTARNMRGRSSSGSQDALADRKPAQRGTSDERIESEKGSRARSASSAEKGSRARSASSARYAGESSSPKATVVHEQAERGREGEHDESGCALQ